MTPEEILAAVKHLNHDWDEGYGPSERRLFEVFVTNSEEITAVLVAAAIGARTAKRRAQEALDSIATGLEMPF